MKLDPRIIEGKRPFGHCRAEEAKQFIGKKCYFADHVLCFRNLDGKLWGDLTVAILTKVDADLNAYGIDESTYFTFCLPCEWVREHKEPEWRPFKDHAEYKEFLNDGIIESWVKIKDKGDDKIYELMYVGGGDDKICLGCMMFSVSNLFKDFELFNESTGKWQPFGVKE